MTKKILTIGFELASDATHMEELRSKVSLLDWDIVLFKPVIFDLTLSREEDYQGKPCLTDTASFVLKEACEHWRREIKQAIENGKTVIVSLPEIEEVFVATGERQYAGTGRYSRVTRVVRPQTNYATLPISLNATTGTGSAIKLAEITSSRKPRKTKHYSIGILHPIDGKFPARRVCDRNLRAVAEVAGRPYVGILARTACIFSSTSRVFSA
jgi:hypothetical protein